MQFMLLFSRQGKLRLQKWYVPLSDKEKKKITRELVQTVLARKPKMCSFLEWRDLKIVYKRYASLYFCCAIEDQDNELITLEIIHRYVELLDKYFGSVCELDIIFNFEKAYFILDEFLLGGEAQETSKKNVLKAIEQADLLQELTDPHNTSVTLQVQQKWRAVLELSSRTVLSQARKTKTYMDVVSANGCIRIGVEQGGFGPPV
ncbi:AP-1 complex subunit sigma-2 isoform X1 [Oryzias melastigma]|uniref:AP-1 complex subunit sigma-2 isoform X1 n=1 Tax=Oryzias melastigma TaxID=30732 RepID=UPI000CF7B533|nr:AP-1 complex subunit sigma-2 isoform X1 [Oryzias melastigma]